MSRITRTISVIRQLASKFTEALNRPQPDLHHCPQMTSQLYAHL